MTQIRSHTHTTNFQKLFSNSLKTDSFLPVKSECVCSNPLLMFKSWCSNRSKLFLHFKTFFSSQTSCTILFISPLIVREVFSLVQRRQAHTLSEWWVPRERTDSWGPVGRQGAGGSSACPASRNTANRPRRCRVRAGLFLYTTAVIDAFLNYIGGRTERKRSCQHPCWACWFIPLTWRVVWSWTLVL